ncbi:MAG: zinc-dependent metalloprotease [Chloroflexota bacterium]
MSRALRAARLGAWIVVAAGGALVARRLAHDGARTDGGVADWTAAERIAARWLAAAPGRLSDAELAGTADAWAATVRAVVPVLERHLGSPLPGVIERHAVVSRAGWVAANVGTFRQLADRLTPLLGPVPPAGSPLAVARGAGRWMTTRQIAFLLGWRGGRVLGQYDVAILSAEQAPGRLLFVEENIRRVADELDLPLGAFRTWIALHEATHAGELEANPWVRPWLRDRLERQLALVVRDAGGLGGAGVVRLVGRLRDVRREGVSAGLLPPEARVGFREVQRMMSLLEGYGDWVMDHAGAELLPDVARMRRAFEGRRARSRTGPDRFVARLTGMDLKLEQYHRGERFIAAIVAGGGDDALRWLWSGPDAFPTEDEMDHPARWVRRMAGTEA